jgi:LuxR family maltose regulon positive regulatory protein
MRDRRLRTAEPTAWATQLALLAAPQPPPIQLVLMTLLNDLAAAGRNNVLVLDDYRLIDALEVHEAMTLLQDDPPPRLHFMIASRTDPAFPLARLRARVELVEIRG